MSALRLYGWPRATSGAMNRREPVPPDISYMPSGVFCSGSSSLARPKSNSLTRPSKLKPTLSGFRSRKTIFSPCRCRIAPQMSVATCSRCRNMACSSLMLLGDACRSLRRLSSFQMSIRLSSVSYNRSTTRKYPPICPVAKPAAPAAATPCRAMMDGWGWLLIADKYLASSNKSAAPLQNSLELDMADSFRNLTARSLRSMFCFTCRRCCFWSSPTGEDSSSSIVSSS
mmetsp:Transcript_6043/g.17190  ORF Transcript_6043/g.17190 Transcript_6043/m.17190 type:complete len:228 (+) Transcript_6043:493-1176(+)